MRAFPRLSQFYQSWMKRLQSSGVEFMLKNQAVEVHRGKDSIKIAVQTIENANTLHEGEATGEIRELEFDEIIFACDAHTALTILGDQATFLERKVLGNVKVGKSLVLTNKLVPDPHPISICTMFRSPTTTKSTWKRYAEILSSSMIFTFPVLLSRFR